MTTKRRQETNLIFSEKKLYETVIGLEVHVQLKSRTKIFCGCSADSGGEPNTRVCPICLGFPGVLPVLNRKVLKLAVRAGLALNCEVSEFSKFDRKNYFYPDLPKAYQISQFDLPLNGPGYLDLRLEGKTRRIGITRAHLEEDAGKLVHFENDGFSGVDYNRTGVPLLEIVSDPDLRSPREASGYLKAIRSIMRYIDVSDCDMEKGSFRCDANISLRPVGTEKLGVKVEIKNMNSFKGVERAIAYEVERQREALDKGETIIQETRLYNADSQKTFSMRSKEEAHDYRYFPDPDLTPIVLEKKWIEGIRSSLPELPDPRRERFQKQYGLPEYDAGVLTAEKQLADYFEAAAALTSQYKTLSNWIMVELLGKLNEADLEIKDSPVSPVQMAGLLSLIEKGAISGKIAKQVFAEMFNTGKEAEVVVEEKGLLQISDTGELDRIVEEVISNNPAPVNDYRGGKKQALGFLVGQIMKSTRGKANPGLVNQLLRDKLAP
ncbi:MAG: Asp-tRNA(Asn)/Glu-tRNA(Gln) amidotransferase subunit GatB [Candidatus Auribacterota bacterium]|nr:Asp-tRNA(Asn)/Glu-tRNA(Gln) amidotransferase subunit GatB [Candidatus Auribacterota bacterium]